MRFRGTFRRIQWRNKRGRRENMRVMRNIRAIRKIRAIQAIRPWRNSWVLCHSSTSRITQIPKQDAHQWGELSTSMSWTLCIWSWGSPAWTLWLQVQLGRMVFQVPKRYALQFVPQPHPRPAISTYQHNISKNKDELHTSHRTPRGGSQFCLRVSPWKRPRRIPGPGAHRFASELSMFVCCTYKGSTPG